MADNSIQVNYEMMDQIARGFKNEAEEIAALSRGTRARLDQLVGGEWRGSGADAFHSEMDSRILPALQRLEHALRDSEHTTRQITQAFHDAEGEAAGQFKGDGKFLDQVVRGKLPITLPSLWGLWSGLGDLQDLAKGVSKPFGPSSLISPVLDILADKDPDIVRRVGSGILAGGLSYTIALEPHAAAVLAIDGISQGMREIDHLAAGYWDGLIASSPAIHVGMDQSAEQMNAVWSRATLSPIIKDLSRGMMDYVTGGNNIPAMVSDVFQHPNLANISHLGNVLEQSVMRVQNPIYGIGGLIVDSTMRDKVLDDGKAVFNDAANFAVAAADLKSAVDKYGEVNAIGIMDRFLYDNPLLGDQLKNQCHEAAIQYIDQINNSKNVLDYVLDVLPQQRDY